MSPVIRLMVAGAGLAMAMSGRGQAADMTAYYQAGLQHNAEYARVMAQADTVEARVGLSRAALLPDRKSTRLNSSH